MIVHAEPTNRGEWLQARKGTIGASEVPTVMGINPWQTPLKLWMVMTEKVEPFAGNEATEIGHRMEPVIAACYEEETGRTVTDPGDFYIARNPDLPHMHATTDRGILASGHDVCGVLELKNVGPRMIHHWGDGAPLYVEVQLQAQLAVTKANWGSIAAMLGGSHFIWQDFEADERFIAHMIGMCEAFMEMVKADMPPEPTADDAEAVRLLAPQHVEGKTIKLDAEALHIEDIITANDRLIKDLKVDADTARNRLKLLFGDAEIAILPDGSKWSYKRQVTKEHTVREFEKRVLRRLKNESR